MNNAITFDEGLLCRPERPEGLLSFLVPRSKSSSKTLAPSSSKVLNGCWEAIDQILRNAIEARTKAEFVRVLDEVFPNYVNLTMAVSHFASAVIPRTIREQLVRDSICELEADFRDKGLDGFGATVRDQALFTVWTLRKVSDLTAKIVDVPLDKSRKHEDAEFCYRFNVNALQAQFSLDCLETSMRTGRAIYPEVLEEVVDGLRAMVNAYTWARRGLDLRLPTAEDPVESIALDEEDVALMDFAFSEVSERMIEG